MSEKKFSPATIRYIESQSKYIHSISQKLGISEGAIAGSIANEFDSRISSSIFSLLSAGPQAFADAVAIFRTNNSLVENYKLFQNMSEAEIAAGNFSKRDNPILIDVGPANIKIITAINLLNDYLDKNQGNDFLGLAKYKDDYKQLAWDLTDWNSDTTAKFTGLMIQRGETILSQKAANWNTISQTEKDAILVTFFKEGEGVIESHISDALAKGVAYNPVPGSGGTQHLVNAAALKDALAHPLNFKDCFPAGTHILMADGSQKAIEHIRVGDEVAAFDTNNDDGRGPLLKGRVSRIFTNTTREFIVFKQGDRDLLTVTSGHRLLTAHGIFEHADRIAASGQSIIDQQGSAIKATSTRILYGEETRFLFEEASTYQYYSNGSSALAPQLQSGWATYNFEVETLHNYIANGVRVHNDSVTHYLPKGAILLGAVPDETGHARDMVYLRKDDVVVSVHGINDGHGNTVRTDEKYVYLPDSPDGHGATVVQHRTYDPVTKQETSRFVDYIEYQDHIYEDIGNTLGTTIGSLIGGNTFGGQIAAQTVVGTFMQEVAHFLEDGFKLSQSLVSETGAWTDSVLGSALTDTFQHFGSDFKFNLDNAIDGGIASLLVSEAGQALGLKGFEGGLFNTIGTSITTQLVRNIHTMVSVALDAGSTDAVQVSDLFKGFDAPTLFGNIATAVGGYLGTYLASQVIVPDNPQAGYGTSIGSALGSTAGAYAAGTLFTTSLSTTLGILIPGVGAFIGAFIGDVLGTLLGNALGTDQKSWGSVWIDPFSGKAVAGNYGSDDSGDWTMFEKITTAQAELVNRIVSLAGAKIIGLKQPTTGTVGYWQKGTTDTVYLPDGSAYNFISRITPDPDKAWADVSDKGVMALLSKVRLSGSDPIKLLAFNSSKSTSASGLISDLDIARSYETYIHNPEPINFLIKKDPKSPFSIGWGLTLLRAEELGLDKITQLTTNGTAKADKLGGTTLVDIIKGLKGDDTITGLDGADSLYGDHGQDKLSGNQGDAWFARQAA